MLSKESPSGPSTSRTRGGSILVTILLCFGGSSNRRLTSAGTDTGAEPIREACRALLENGREGLNVESAGTRKSGMVAVNVEYDLKKRKEDPLTAISPELQTAPANLPSAHWAIQKQARQVNEMPSPVT